MSFVQLRSAGQKEFHQAVSEVASDVLPWIRNKSEYRDARVLERLTEPDRALSFRVCWYDDDGELHINRGYRVQLTNAIGPYKGGLRFHPSVNESVLKFLAFEQAFKNSLTGLPLGSAKGGSDFDPKNRSNAEIMRFCQSFMSELYRHIGPDTDIPAGDIGVGAREIGYLYGQYKRIRNECVGVLTGKGLEYGGSALRSEATGYGVVHFTQCLLKHHGLALDGLTVAISGSGNVALHAAEKAVEMGAKVITLSDSGGYVLDPDGMSPEKLAWVTALKTDRRGRISEYVEEFNGEYHAGQSPWRVNCDIAMPCATQNEIDNDDAIQLIKNGCRVVAEGSNMPTGKDAIQSFIDAGVLFAPAKAANAGGVAMSGLEMSQNAQKRSWSDDELAQCLESIMLEIHDRCVEYATRTEDGRVNYRYGANVAGFKKVADAMLSFGVC